MGARRFIFRFSRRLAVRIAGFAALAAVLAVVCFAGAAAWLRGADGQAWVRARIDRALAAGPYSVSYESAVLSPGPAFDLSGLAVSDADGAILTSDHIRIDVNPAALLMRRAVLHIDADRIAILRLPRGGGASSRPGPAFDPAAFPLRSIALDRLRVARLDLAAGVAGRALTLSPDIRARAAFGAKGLPVAVAGVFRRGPGTEALDAYLPLSVAVTGRIGPSLDGLDLDALSLRQDHFTVDGEGAVGFGPEGSCDARLRADIDSLSALAGLPDGALTVKARCAGPTLRPKLDLESRFVFRSMGDLAPVDFTLSTSPEDGKLTGRARVEGAYKGQAYGLDAPFTLAGNALTLPALEGTLPETAIGGHIAYDFDRNLAGGAITADIRSLAPYGALAGLPLRGRAMLSLTLSQGDRQEAELSVKAENLALDALRAASATLGIHSADIRASRFDRAELRVKGASFGDSLLDSGLLTVVPAAADATGTLAFTLDAAGRAGGLPLKAQGRGQIAFGGSSGFENLRLDSLSVASRGTGLARISGAFSPAAVDMQCVLARTPLSVLAPGAPGGLGGMTVSGTLALKGASASPTASFTAKAEPGQGGRRARLPAMTLTVDGAYDGRILTAAFKGAGGDIGALTGRADIPVGFSLWPFRFRLPGDAPLDAALSARLDARAIARMALPYDMDLRGPLTADITARGPWTSPVLAGRAAMKGGSFHHLSSGFALESLTFDAAFDNNRITLSSLGATDGGTGRLRATGWAEPFGRTHAASATIQADGLHALRGDMADAVASARLALRPARGGFMLSGTVGLGETTIRIPERFGPSIPELNTVRREDLKTKAAPAMSVFLDIKAAAPSRVFVRGWGLDAEFGGGIDIAGTLARPEAFGDFSAIRGRFEQFGKVFSLDTARLVFQGAIPPSPMLDVTVSTPARDVTAKILMQGPAADPKLSFASDPALPQDEVLSRILFGKDASSISPLQAAQLANALRRFSGIGGGSFDPVASLRNASGLDQLQVDTGENGAVTVGAGKYITDRIYVEGEQGASSGSSAVKVQAEITPSVSLESRVGQDKTGAGLFWKRDY